MKKISILIFYLNILVLFSILMMPVIGLTEEKFEHYNVGDDIDALVYANTWLSQTFTPSKKHTITSVRLKLFREGLPHDLTVSLFIDPASSTWQVGASSDDCFRQLVESYFSLIEPLCVCGDYALDNYDLSSGMRFTNLNIPQGSTINSAYLKLEAASVEGPIPTTFIEGQNSDNAATFSTLADYDGRPRTSASVSWTPAAWVDYTWCTSSDIKTVIQEIVDRAGWASGNALALFWRDAAGYGASGYLEAYSYEAVEEWPNNAANAPKLEVTWTTPVTNNQRWIGIAAPHIYAAITIWSLAMIVGVGAVLAKGDIKDLPFIILIGIALLICLFIILVIMSPFLKL